MPSTFCLRRLKEKARRERRRKQAVSSVIGGIIMFGILFTVGFFYFYTTSQQLRMQSNLISQQTQESFEVTGYANTVGGNIEILVNNTGSIAITVQSIIVTYANASGYSLNTFTVSPSNDISTPKLPISINPGGSYGPINTGVPVPATGSYKIEVITRRGTTETWSPQGYNISRISGIINGLGSFGLVYNSFKFYYAAAYQYGDGYQVGGYYGFEVPSGQQVVFQLSVTNYDPEGRSIIIDDRSAIWLPSTSFFGGGASCAGASNGGFNLGNTGQCLYIVGNLVNNQTGCSQTLNSNFFNQYGSDYGTIDGGCVGAKAFTTITVPYGASALLNFSASMPGCPALTFSNSGGNFGQNSQCQSRQTWWNPGQLGVRGDAPIFLLLFGSYSDNTIFGQNIPFVSSYGTIAMIQPVYQPSNGNSCVIGSENSAGYCVGTNAPMTNSDTVVNVALGQTYYLNVISLNATADVWWVNTNGQVQNITYASSLTSPEFTVPTNAVPGQYYALYAFDQINSAYATVRVWGGIPTITTTLEYTSINMGTTDYDTSTFTSGVDSQYTPTGTVQYQYFTGTTSCSGSPTNDGNPVSVVNGVPQNSPTVTFSAAGPYSWQAIYSGDTNNMGATSACETLAVKASPTLSQSFSGSGNSITDTVKETGGYNSLSGDTVTISYYSASSCTGTPKGSYADTFSSAGQASQGSLPSGYYVLASFAGDTYDNAATSSCALD